MLYWKCGEKLSRSKYIGLVGVKYIEYVFGEREHRANSEMQDDEVWNEVNGNCGIEKFNSNWLASNKGAKCTFKLGIRWHFIPFYFIYFAYFMYEEFHNTVLIRVEACLNTNPLTSLFSDLSNLTFLTTVQFESLKYRNKFSLDWPLP